MRNLATKSHEEWEDEAVEEVHGKSLPKSKPPRHDLRKHRIKKDYDSRNGDRDLQPIRKSADNHLPGEVWQTPEGKWRGRNPAGNDESFDDKDDAEEFASGKMEDFDEEAEALEEGEEGEEDPDLQGEDEEDEEDHGEDLEDQEDDQEDARNAAAEGRALLMQAEKAVQEVFKSGKTFLPEGSHDSLARALGMMRGSDRRKFLRYLRKNIDTYISKNGFQSFARTSVNAVAGIEDFSEFSEPRELAKKVALLAYGANVVSNPKILGGLPVSRDPKTPDQLAARSLEAYQHFKGLAEPWRIHAAKTIQKELKQDPKGPRARELEAILTGISVAHAIESGKGLPGRPEPSQGAIELFKKMAEDGQESLLFKPAEDFFVPENRTTLRQAIARVPIKDIPQLLVGDDQDHPFRKLTDVLGNPKVPGPLKTAVRSFLEEEALVSMTWKDRAFRDALEGTSRGEMSPQERREEMLKAGVSPEMEAFLAGVEKVKSGESLDRDESLLLRDVETSKGKNLLHAGVAKFVGWLQSAFSKKPKGSAGAILRKFVETGDSDWLDRPVTPHPDQKREKTASFSLYRNHRYRRHPATPERSIMPNIRITKRAANLVVGQLERAADIIQRNHKQLGLDVKVAFDFARRADLLADYIDRRAGIDRQAQARLAAQEKAAQGPAATISYDFENFTETDLSDLDFDPSEIGEMSEGALMRDPDEPYMDVFNQDEYFQLAEVQEQGMFSNARVASKNASKKRRSR